jgi:DNA-binding transcriptional LysR family regulator
VHLLRDPYYVILPSVHPLARRRSIALADLAGEPWIVPQRGSGCREGVVRACRVAGFEPRLAIESDENEQVQAFVSGGLGVALWPRLALANLQKGVAVKRLAGEGMERHVYAATIAGSYRSPASEAMLTILREVGEEFRSGEWLEGAAA